MDRGVWLEREGTAGLSSSSTVKSPVGPDGAGVWAGQVGCGGAWVAVNKLPKASWCGQWRGRCRAK